MAKRIAKRYIYENVKAIKLQDGDSFDAEITVTADIGFEVKTVTILPQRFRVKGLDTPEIYSPKNKRELAHGQEAFEFAKTLLLDKVLYVESFRTDLHGRYQVNIRLPDGSDFATVMKANGFQKKEKY